MSSVKASKKENPEKISTAIVIYKGSSSIREAADNEAYEFQSLSDSFDEILNSPPNKDQKGKKKRMRS